MGKVLEFSVQDEEKFEFYLNKKAIARNILDLRISCVLQLKKKKKYKVKFKVRNNKRKTNQSYLVDEFFVVSKRMKKLFDEENVFINLSNKS
jgi:hypothetical protein